MKRTIISKFPSLCLTSALFAQPAPIPSPAVAPPDREIIPEVRTHRISATTATHILATAPKFMPPAAPRTDHGADADHPRDQPKNGIVRLPEYIVNEPKAPALKERELLTDYGRLQLALKRHPGLRFNPIPFLNNNRVALAMLEEEFRLERKAEMEDLAGLITSPTARAQAKEETQKAFMRTSFGRRSAK